VSNARIKRKARLRRRQAARTHAVPVSKPTVKLTPKQRIEPLRGWYLCCGVFYAGYAWSAAKKPPCPGCGERAQRNATMGEVYE